MEKSKILKKVEQREYEKRCVNVRVCPKCGQTLVSAYDEDPADRVCKACNMCWDHVQNGF